MSQYTQLAANEVFQHCGVLIHNPKFTLKWILFCSPNHQPSATPLPTHTHTQTHIHVHTPWGGGIWNVNEVSSPSSPDGRRDGPLFSACSYLSMIESLPAVCACVCLPVRSVCVCVQCVHDTQYVWSRLFSDGMWCLTVWECVSLYRFSRLIRKVHTTPKIILQKYNTFSFNKLL